MQAPLLTGTARQLLLLTLSQMSTHACAERQPAAATSVAVHAHRSSVGYLVNASVPAHPRWLCLPGMLEAPSWSNVVGHGRYTCLGYFQSSFGLSLL